MTRRRARVLLAAAATLTAVAAPGASAAEEPVFAEKQVYFHCTGPTKLVNVNQATGAGIPGWDAKAPTLSVTEGGGCGTVDPAFLVDATEAPSPSTDGVWTGTVKGNVDTLTVDVYALFVGTAKTGVQQYGLTPVLWVDGVRRVTNPGVVNVTNVPGETMTTDRITFSVTGLGLTEDLDGDGAADAGPGTTTRKVTLQLRNQFVNTNGLGGWTFDTTENPSGIVFNPSVLAPVKVPLA